MEGLSKEFMINEVKAHKDIIRDATDRLSDLLFKIRTSKSLELDQKDSVALRKILHEIVSELSIIGGYCDNWTKNYINKTVNLIGRKTAVSSITYGHALILDWWAMRINGIIINFTKTPFKLDQLKPIFSILKKAIDTQSKPQN